MKMDTHWSQAHLVHKLECPCTCSLGHALWYHPHHGFQNFLVHCLDALTHSSLQLQFGCCFPASFICLSLQDGPHVLNRAQLRVLLLGDEGDTLPFQKFLGLPGVVTRSQVRPEEYVLSLVFRVDKRHQPLCHALLAVRFYFQGTSTLTKIRF